MVISQSKIITEDNIIKRTIEIEGERDKISLFESKLKGFRVGRDYSFSDDGNGRKTYDIISLRLRKVIYENVRPFFQVFDGDAENEELVMETDINEIESNKDYLNNEEPWWRKKISDAEIKDAKGLKNQTNSPQIEEIIDEETDKQIEGGTEAIKSSSSKNAKKNKGENFNEKQLDGKDKDNFFAKQKKENDKLKENNIIVGDKRNNPQNKGITNKYSGIFIFVGLFSFIVGVVLAVKP